MPNISHHSLSTYYHTLSWNMLSYKANKVVAPQRVSGVPDVSLSVSANMVFPSQVS